MDDIAILEDVLRKVEGLISNTLPGQLANKTPCPEYDVATLINHVIGWSQVFGNAANGIATTSDANAFQASSEPAKEYRIAADAIIEGWRNNGIDREVPMMGHQSPGMMIFNVTLCDAMGHGWDLAKGTGQEVPFNDQEAERALNGLKSMLSPEHRGEGQGFGEIVEVPESAPMIDQFVGFAGRHP